MRRRFQIAISGHVGTRAGGARRPRALPGKTPSLLTTLGMLIAVVGAVVAALLFGSLLIAGLWVFFVLLATVAVAKGIVRGMRRG